MTVVAAAIKIGDAVVSMARPARHHDILRQISRLYAPTPRPGWTFEDEVQGFISDEGEFLGRREAFMHCLENGQSLPRRMTAGPHSYDGEELFSEDLW